MSLNAYELDNFRRLADNLAALLGPTAEVVVHDLEDLQHSIVYIAGDVTHREIGSPMTNMGLEALRKGTETSLLQGSYRSELPDGRVLKCSSTFLRSASGHSTVAICINIDITHWAQAADLIADFATVGSRADLQEDYIRTVPEMIEVVVMGAVSEMKKTPETMDGAERLELVRTLDERGVFLIKGALGYVSTLLGVSRATVYNYLQRVRSEQLFPKAES
jgi:predicted transcriptional regulator YheO